VKFCIAVTLFQKSRLLGEKVLPANVTIFILNLKQTDSPIFTIMDNSPGSTIRKSQWWQFYRGTLGSSGTGSIFSSTKSLLL